LRRLRYAGLFVAALLVVSLVAILQFSPFKSGAPAGLQSSSTMSKLALKMEFNYTRGGDPPPDAVWANTYGGSALDRAYSVVETIDSGYAFLGITQSFGSSSQSAWMVKTNSEGIAQWSKTFGGSADNWGRALLRNPDGTFTAAGYTESTGPVGYTPARGAGGFDGWLFRVDPDGNMVWEKLYGGTANDYIYALAPTSDGGYILAGATSSGGTASQAAWLIEVDSAGNEIWSTTYGGTLADAFYSVVQMPGGGFMAVGMTNSLGAGLSDVWVVTTDSSGVQQSSHVYGQAGSDAGYSVISTGDGNYAVAGETYSLGRGTDVLLIKVDSSGAALWNRTYGGTSDDSALSSVRTYDDAILLGGFTSSTGAGGKDFFLMKVDTFGNAIWNATMGGSADDVVYCVAATTDRGVVIAGSTLSFGAGGEDAWVIRLGSNFFFYPYVNEGVLNATMIAGLSQPHGPSGAANSLDTVAGMQVAEGLGALKNAGYGQYFLDTDVSVYDGGTGIVSYIYSNLTNIITIGGPGVNQVTYKYIANPFYAPVYEIFNASSGKFDIHSPTTTYYEADWVNSSADLVVLQSIYVAAEGRYVMYLGGFGGPATRAACLIMQLQGSGLLPFTLQGRAVIVQWVDANLNAKVDSGDTFNVIEVVP
jgi:hypothetical protein